MNAFLPAGEIIGAKHQFRILTINDSPQLPGGEYTLMDLYCNDSNCDCRKTIIQIHRNGEHVSTVNYGWEKPGFYVKWARGDDPEYREMSGLSIDFTSPDLIPSEAILPFMDSLLDETYINKIKTHYREVRTTLKQERQADNIIRLTPKISRNAPCPCGSGKKHKQCCLSS